MSGVEFKADVKRLVENTGWEVETAPPTIIGTDSLPGRPQYIPPKDPIIQYIEPELRLLLGLAAQLPSQPGKFQGQARFWLKPFFRKLNLFQHFPELIRR